MYSVLTGCDMWLGWSEEKIWEDMDLGLQQEDNQMFSTEMSSKKQTVCKPKQLRVVCAAQTEEDAQTFSE